ncbi:MAG: DNA-binding response regulator [Lachnospiraceae bacterium]|nr:DNA-binding response regulator [Lachnospiraceae bacterium]
MVQVMLVNQEFLFQNAFRKMVDDINECQLVGVAESGVEAMDMMSRLRPKVVFADVLLGLENGIQLCAKIKEKFPDTMVYLLSNYCNFNLIRESMQAGIADFLLKPLSRCKLSTLLTECYQEKITIADSMEEELFTAVEKRDYQKACTTSNQLIDRMFVNDDTDQRKQNLEAVAEALFRLVPVLDQEQIRYYLKKYELTTKTVNKKPLCYLWLTQIITSVFRQLCIVKYTHMNQAFQYIEKNLREEISLTELSEQAGISNGYLSRIFKKYYHISVVDYIHLRKLHMAKYYMISTEMNISDIAFMMGYSEAGYFCKIFKKYEGMTPSAYLNLIVKEK